MGTGPISCTRTPPAAPPMHGAGHVHRLRAMQASLWLSAAVNSTDDYFQRAHPPACSTRPRRAAPSTHGPSPPPLRTHHLHHQGWAEASQRSQRLAPSNRLVACRRLRQARTREGAGLDGWLIGWGYLIGKQSGFSGLWAQTVCGRVGCGAHASCRPAGRPARPVVVAPATPGLQARVHACCTRLTRPRASRARKAARSAAA